MSVAAGDGTFADPTSTHHNNLDGPHCRPVAWRKGSGDDKDIAMVVAVFVRVVALEVAVDHVGRQWRVVNSGG